jgi:glycine dehydrogenase
MPQSSFAVDRPVEVVPHSSGQRRVESRAAGAAESIGPSDLFPHRHIGPDERDVEAMLKSIGCASLDELIDSTVPASIRLNRPLDLGGSASRPRGEHELLIELREIAKQNQVFRSFIGQGYYGTITPPVILRNIMENPGWYTQYTPYQAEISQGRLEALLNFQTMVSDLTGLPVANASLLDEGTAAAEALTMAIRIVDGRESVFVAADCHPQTINVVRTRMKSLGIRVDVGDVQDASIDFSKQAGVLVQYPTTDGRVECYESAAKRAHEQGAIVVAATDLLALTLLKPPGEWGADIAVGSSQRFGVPMGFGGPHAAFMATKDEHVRKMPGRLIGVSKDAHGRPALRMAIQTREQHIKRDRATSNICTAQVLLAVMAGMYAVYHGPDGLKAIAKRVRLLTHTLRVALRRAGHRIDDAPLVFDTLRVEVSGMTASQAFEALRARRINARDFGDGAIGLSLDETATIEDVQVIVEAMRPGGHSQGGGGGGGGRSGVEPAPGGEIPTAFARTSSFLTHPVFNTHHSETEMLRYIRTLEKRDLSLGESMISLGSCTMKLNATSEMIPVTWAEFGAMHPYAPAEQTKGYQRLFADLEAWLSEITGFAAVSLQPNAGSQGEYAGLLAIQAYHASRGETKRDICLIPTSAHGTNPASAIVAGMKVVTVECDDSGNVLVSDLRAKAAAHRDTLAAFMITYPSTHGVFEESIREMCSIVHEFGGQVYMDGANMNAQVGLCRPGDIGADVCHLNLHKTFCIPHGGGGPGMGPIGVAKHLVPFLPGDPNFNGAKVGAVSSANWGSASILPISWVYIALMGASGLRRATEVAILNANYMATRLEGRYDVLYRGRAGRVAHEFIVDCRAFEKSAGVKVEDIAKRLMDYGFHAPTMSFPVPGTLMIEPTESESKSELDRFCDALITIREEIREIEAGGADRLDNVLKHAPHTIAAVSSDDWRHAYAREKAAFPLPWLRDHKFWPSVGRIDNPYGDRNLVCTCPPIEAYSS